MTASGNLENRTDTAPTVCFNKNLRTIQRSTAANGKAGRNMYSMLFYIISIMLLSYTDIYFSVFREMENTSTMMYPPMKGSGVRTNEAAVEGCTLRMETSMRESG